jgi:hypothetical protein
MQGDVAFCDALERMGCGVEWHEGDESGRGNAITVAGRAARGIDIDMNAISDTVPTLAVVAVFADGPTTIRNVAHIRDKETDRIGDLVRELRRLGASVEEHADGMTITPPRRLAADLRRPPDGDEPVTRRPAGTGHRHPGSGMRRQDVSRLLDKPGWTRRVSCRMAERLTRDWPSSVCFAIGGRLLKGERGPLEQRIDSVIGRTGRGHRCHQ